MTAPTTTTTPLSAAEQLHAQVVTILQLTTTLPPEGTAQTILDAVALTLSRRLDMDITEQEKLLATRGTAGLADQAHEHGIAARIHRNDQHMVRVLLGLDQEHTSRTRPNHPATIIIDDPHPDPLHNTQERTTGAAFSWWTRLRRGEQNT